MAREPQSNSRTNAAEKRRRQVNDALRQIKPKTEYHDGCREDIEYALNVIEVELANQRAGRKVTTKDERAATRVVEAALKKLRAAVKNSDLDDEFHLFFPHAEIEEWLAKCEEIERKPVRRARRTDPRRLLAAREALRLLNNYSVDRKTATVTTKGKRFGKLAAVLAGVPDADLHHECRAARKFRNVSFSKMFEEPSFEGAYELHNPQPKTR